MVTSKIRCFVVRIPDEDAADQEVAVPPRAAWREALPWADPYILGLIRKLQAEVRMERAARFMAERETAEGDDDDGVEVVYDGLVIERETASPKHVPATAVAADGSPPGNVVTAEPTEEDEGEWEPPTHAQRLVRRPR